MKLILAGFVAGSLALTLLGRAGQRPEPPVPELARAAVASPTAIRPERTPPRASEPVGAAEPAIAPAAAEAIVRSAEEAANALLRSLHEACAAKHPEEIERLCAELRELLAHDDPAVEGAVFAAVHANLPGSSRVQFLLYTYPDLERRRILREHLAEAAPPAPAALPALDDAGAVASFLTGPRSSADRLWLLRRLEGDVLADPGLQSALADLALRSEDGDALARTAFQRIGHGPSDVAERVALRVLDTTLSRDLRRDSIRLLGRPGSAAATDRLIEIVRTDPDAVDRRLAAIALLGKDLGERGVATLRAALEDPQEDATVRQHARSALESAVVRHSADAELASAALRDAPPAAQSSEASYAVARPLSPTPPEGHPDE